MSDTDQNDGESMWVYLDDDGVEVPAAAESSVLMAAALGGDETLQPYAEDRQSFEAARLQSMAALEAGLAALAAADAQDEASAIGPRDEVEDNGDDDGGMLGPSGSSGWFREPTDADDWVLSEILARRMDRALGTHTYLCKWKYFPENTWETRETLEDEGHRAAVDAADAAHSDHLRQRTANVRPPASTHLPMQSVLEGAVEDIESTIAKSVGAFNYKVDYLVPVLPRGRETAFLATWNRLKDSHRPTLLFHGTHPRNIRSIIKHSLVVPGTLSGVKVAHGSAHGVGIYTAANPSSPICFAQTFTGGVVRAKLFVCLGLVGASDPLVFQCCSESRVVVFFGAHLVVPLWLVHISDRGAHPPHNGPQWMGHEGAIPRKPYHTFLAETYNENAPSLVPAAPPLLPSPTGTAAPGPSKDARRQEREALSEAAGGVSVDAAFVRRPMTKKMVKAAPRYVKDLFQQGKIPKKV